MSGVEPTMDILRWTHAVASIPDKGLAQDRAATEAECAAVGAALGILACRSLRARYRIAPRGTGVYRLSGRVVADVEQACVVTLEPVAERIEAELSVLLRPAARRQDDALDITDPFDEDEVEEIESGTIDVGRIVYEEIASRLDPYPRAPGADFDWKDEAASENDEEKENPFAKLAALRKEDPQK